MKPMVDPTFPGLTTALDLDAVLELLQRALPECRDELTPIEGQLTEVQYEPGVQCVLSYRIKFRNQLSGRRVRHLLSARLLREDEDPIAPPQALLARYEAYPDKVFATPMVYIPEARMIVYAFPFDVSLPWLLDALDPLTMKQWLGRMWAGRNVRVRKVRAQLLGYTPQARAACRYEILNEDKDTCVPEVRRLVGKIHVSREPASRFAGAWAVWRAAYGRIHLAAPVGYMNPANLSLQELVAGERLSDLAGHGSFVKLVRKTARAIAALHGLSLPLTALRTAEKEVKVIHRWADVLTAVCPDQARRIDRLRRQLVAAMEAHIHMKCPVHGDMHLANVLVDDDHVILIDFDQLAWGDPLVDVGRFLASLRVSALRLFATPSGLANVQEAFLQEYLRHCSEDERKVRLFEAASLLIAAASPFRLQRAGWEEGAVMLVEEAEHVFALARRGQMTGTSGGVPELPGHLGDPMRWLTDNVYMQAVLDPYIREAYGADVTACRAEPLGETKKAYHVIHYHLSVRRNDETWALPLEGILWKERSGSGLSRRLAALRQALAEHPEAPLLPRPIAYLKPLNLQVVETPRGIDFPSLVGTSEAPVAAEKLGRALATLHRARVDLKRSHSVEDELLTLRHRIERLEAQRPDLAAQAGGLLAAVERASRRASSTVAPILRKIAPQHILCLGDGIGVAAVEDVTLSHPFIDVAEFLGQLTLLCMQRGIVAELPELAHRFRHAYLMAGALDYNGLAVFEAAALLRLACVEAERDPKGMVVEHLLTCVDTKLAAP